MRIERFVRERTEDGYFYEYAESGDLGSTSPHHTISRSRDYWCSLDRCAHVGDMRVIGGCEYVAFTIKPRSWFRAPQVLWVPKR